MISMNPMDPNFKRLTYFRYAGEFIILITGSKNDAIMIKDLSKRHLRNKCGIELNEKKTLITRTRDGFNFLGAWCISPNNIKDQYAVKNKFGNRSHVTMRILAPIKQLINKLVINKFVKLDYNGLPHATSRRHLVNFSHYEILNFYNYRINGLLEFYSFAGNVNDMRKIIMFLQYSCALTLALKYKIRTKSAAFTRFGRHLRDPETGLSLQLPKTLGVKHDYKGINKRNSLNKECLRPEKLLGGS